MIKNVIHRYGATLNNTLKYEKIVFIIVMILSTKHVQVFGQIEMVVDTLELSQVIEKCPNDLYILSGSMKGVYATFRYYIKNIGNDTVEIYNNQYDYSHGLNITFRYDGKNYKKDVEWAMLFIDNETDVFYKLGKNQQIKAVANAFLIYGCDFFPSVQWTDSNHFLDCTKEVLKILPSLQLNFYNLTCEIHSKEIKNVVLTDTYLIDYEDVKQKILLLEDDNKENEK